MPQSPTPVVVGKTPSGTLVLLACDSLGRLITAPEGASTKNYAANNAGDQAVTGAGVLRGFSVNTAGTTSTVAFYDGTSTSSKLLGTFSTTAQGSLQLNYAFATGLFVVLAGGAAANVTIAWN